MRSQKLLILFSFSLLFFLYSSCKRDYSSIEDKRNINRTIIKKTPPDTTQNPYILTEGGYPDWSPKGEKLAFIRDDALWVYNLIKNEEERISENALEPSFAPDGMRIAFERNKQIWIVDLSSYQEKYLCDGITPSWSENGQWIAFANKNASKTTTDAELIQGEPSVDKCLYYYDLVNKKIESVIVTNCDSLWIGFASSMFSPDWVQDDSLILFSNEITVYLVPRKGGKAIKVLNPYFIPKPAEFSFARQPQWCQKIQRLGYTLYTPRPYENDVLTHIILGFITPDSLNVVGLSEGTDMTWNIDGNKIAYYKQKHIKIKNWRKLL